MIDVQSKYLTKLGEIKIDRFLGKGKSGYSYLGKLENTEVVLKLMHSETNSFYSFNQNKVELEVESYNKLKSITNKIPKLIEYNLEENYLIKEFISGDAASIQIAGNKIRENHFAELFSLANNCETENLNIDYFPSNFIVNGDDLFYIDYEVNKYSENWSFRNWGIYYWLNTNGFKKYLGTGDVNFINEDIIKGVPHKMEFTETAKLLLDKYDNRK